MRYCGINFETELDKNDYCSNMIETAIKSIGLLEHELSLYEIKGIDNLITISTKKIGLLDVSQIEYLYKKGYYQTKKILDGINV